MKKKLYILGSGPRGLAVALYATQYLDKLDVYLVDKNEMSEWKSPKIITTMQMRSPVTFDLVTYEPELQDFSLANFVEERVAFSTVQKNIEQNKVYCSRTEFLNYLIDVRRRVIELGVKPIRKKVSEINSDCLNCSGRNHKFDYLIVAGGQSFTNVKKPYYSAQHDSKIITVEQMLRNRYHTLRNKFVVYGSGQNAAETVALLAEKNEVYWILKHEPKVTQYPVPDFKFWSIRSALGSAYRNTIQKPIYWKQVRQWTPSITPYINNVLEERKENIIKIKPTSVQEVNGIMNEVAYVLCQTGSKPDIGLVPFQFEIARNPHSPCYPNIKNGFASTSNPNIFFTGTLCNLYDGPRQGSIISAGLTAKEILRNIINSMR